MWTILFAIMIITLLNMGGSMLVRSLSAKTKPSELQSDPGYISDSLVNEPLACDALVARVFEQRLVDAGIMKVSEMNVCDDASCDDCRPSRNAKHYEEKCAVGTCRLKGTIRWDENEMLCQKHMDIRKEDAKTKSESKYNRLRAGQSRYDKSARQGELKIKIEHYGVKAEFDWPKDIPTYAAPVVDVNNYERHAVRVKFLWTDSANGKQMVRVAIFPMLEWGGGSPKENSGDFLDAIREAEAPRRAVVRKPMTPERRRRAIAELTGREAPEIGTEKVWK